jgi:hypothetical protein
MAGAVSLKQTGATDRLGRSETQTAKAGDIAFRLGDCGFDGGIAFGAWQRVARDGRAGGADVRHWRTCGHAVRGLSGLSLTLRCAELGPARSALLEHVGQFVSQYLSVGEGGGTVCSRSKHDVLTNSKSAR